MMSHSLSASDLKFVTKLVELRLLLWRKSGACGDAFKKLALPIVETIRHRQLRDAKSVRVLALNVCWLCDPPEKMPAIGADFFSVMWPTGKILDAGVGVFAPGLRATD
jgi:hypothetical protein